MTGAYVYRDMDAVRFRSQIENGAFAFGRLPVARFVFTLRPDGRLDGERTWREGVNRVVLTRR